MLTRPVHGTNGEERRWYFDFYEQWSGLFGGSNWYDFTLLNIEGEYAPYSGRWEFSLALLGLRVTVTYVFDHTFNRKMSAMVDEIKEELKK